MDKFYLYSKQPYTEYHPLILGNTIVKGGKFRIAKLTRCKYRMDRFNRALLTHRLLLQAASRHKRNLRSTARWCVTDTDWAANQARGWCDWQTHSRSQRLGQTPDRQLDPQPKLDQTNTWQKIHQADGLRRTERYISIQTTCNSLTQNQQEKYIYLLHKHLLWLAFYTK